MMNIVKTIALCCLISTLGLGCSDLTTLDVKMVDAPIVLDNGLTVEELNVVITRVDVVRNGSEECNSEEIKSGDGVFTVLDGEEVPSEPFNLLDYVDGASKLLGSVDLEPGEYLQLRFIVDIEQSTIKFADDEVKYPLQIPSGEDSGVKIKGNALNPLFVIDPASVVEAVNSEIVIDFDAQLSIIAGVDKDNYKLSPVIKEVKFNNRIVYFYQDGPKTE